MSRLTTDFLKQSRDVIIVKWQFPTEKDIKNHAAAPHVNLGPCI